MLNELRALNETYIKKASNDDELKKQMLIKELLKNDRCFFKISIKDAYSILRDLKIKQDKLKIVYEKLIEESNF